MAASDSKHYGDVGASNPVVDGSPSSSARQLDSVKEFEAMAKARLPRGSWNFFEAGTEGNAAMENEKAFQRFYLRPRALHADCHREQTTTVFGQRMSSPIGIAPTAYHCLAHPSAEVGTAKGANKFGSIMVVSSWATTRIEDIAAAAPGTILWMQLGIFKNRKNTINLVRRAERLGFSALVVTIDTPLQSKRKRAVCSGLGKAVKDRLRLVNIQGAVDEIEAAVRAGDKTLAGYMCHQKAAFAKWSDIAWLKRKTRLPVVVKGVLTAETAREAVSVGVDGIIVSAHGGRNLEGALHPIDALPEVIDAVKGTGVEVFMDGGVRSGTDVFKCLALGAKMAFIGRPALWGLAVEGADGVHRVLELLSEELDYVMANCGCNRIDEISPSHVGHTSQLQCKL